MMRRAWFVIAVGLGAAACKSDKAAPPAASSGSASSGSAEHAGLPPELAKFHDVLAPRWHAPKGPQRMQDTCGALAEFHAGADAVAKATAASGAAAAKALVDAVAQLDTACKANDATAFEPAFEQVHRAFHGLLEGHE